MYSSGHFRADNNSVRKTTAALIVIGLVWVSYIAWPLYQLTVLVRAIDAHDVSTMMRYIERKPFERDGALANLPIDYVPRP